MFREIKALNMTILVMGFIAMLLSSAFSFWLSMKISNVNQKVKFILNHKLN